MAAYTQVAELIAAAENPFALCIEQYRRQPNAFWREVLGMEPDPWQVEANRALARGQTKLSIRSGHGVGKGHPVELSVPTPAGQRRWGDLQPGDVLFGADGKPTEITHRHELGPRQIYRVVLCDGTFSLVTEDHLWAVRSVAASSSSKHQVVSTAELMQAGVMARTGGRREPKWKLPLGRPALYPAVKVPVDPFLFGVWLSHGNEGGTTMGGKEASVDQWKGHCGRIGMACTVSEHAGGRAVLDVPDMAAGLAELGVLDTGIRHRSVTNLYLQSAAHTRYAVLSGLMEAGGDFDDNCRFYFEAISPALADEVPWLVRSLGGYAWHENRVLPGEPQEMWRVLVDLESNERLFKDDGLMRPAYGSAFATPPPPARHIVAIEPDGEAEAMCVTVAAKDGLYLANDFIPTHNSTWSGATICWFCNTRAPFKVGVTAPSAPQLFDALWAETRSVFNRLPPAWRDLWTITESRITLKSAPDECFVTARTARADTPEAIAGIHSENTMLLVDEASGVSEAVYEAGGGSMSTPGAIMILTGNPTRSTGYFWRSHNLDREAWWTLRVSARDSPRVQPKFWEDIIRSDGENSNKYRVRVLGEFPEADDDTLIAAELVEGAMQRDTALDLSVPEIWGIDVARFGRDASTMVKRRGFVVPEQPRRWQGLDTMQLAGIIKAEWDMLAPVARPAMIAVDVIGIGAGVVDRLQEQHLPVIGVNVAEAPSTAGRFARLRDELWFRTREWLESRRPRLPHHDRLRTDLCAPRVTFLSDGRMQVESKASLRSRGFASPDVGDGLVNTFLPAGMALQGGLGMMLTSRQPVRAAIRGME